MFVDFLIFLIFVFFDDSNLFSKKLLEGRISQFRNAQLESRSAIFIDRGLPDVLAYMDYIGDTYPQYFVDACTKYKYDYVFVLAPWQEIFTSDSERYENFEQAIEIHEHLLQAYMRFGYQLIDVPFGSIEDRSDFILEELHIK